MNLSEQPVLQKMLHLAQSFFKEQYQLLMMLQQIQTVFILSHELGHLLHPDITGLHGEMLHPVIPSCSFFFMCCFSSNISK